MVDRTITTTGIGRAAVHPELAQVVVESHGSGSTPVVARKQATEKTTEIQSMLADEGVAVESIRTTDLQVTHRSNRFEADETDPEYRAVETIIVDYVTDGINEVVVGATDAGGQVKEVEFAIHESTRDDVKQRALQEAMTDARKRAETIAAAEDLRVDTVEEVVTEDSDEMQGIVDEVIESPTIEFEPDPIAEIAEVRVTYSVLTSTADES